MNKRYLIKKREIKEGTYPFNNGLTSSRGQAIFFLNYKKLMQV